MRAITRACDVHLDTVTKLLVDAGEACMAYHDEHVRGLHSKRIQVDEIWAFVYAKEKNVPHAKKAPYGAGDAWTWLALDADHKVMVSWVVGPRTGDSAWELMQDLAERIVGRVQITTDGLLAYLDAVEGVFGADVDFAQLIKVYGPAPGRRARAPVQPGDVSWHARQPDHRRPGPRPHQHVVHRAPEPEHQDAEPAVHEADQRVLEEAGEPRVPGGAVHGFLQLLPDPHDVEDDACDGGRAHGRAARCRLDRGPGGGARSGHPGREGRTGQRGGRSGRMRGGYAVA